MRNNPRIPLIVLLCLGTASCARLPWRGRLPLISRRSAPAPRRRVSPEAKGGAAVRAVSIVPPPTPAPTPAPEKAAATGAAGTEARPDTPRRDGHLLLGAGASSLTDALDRTLAMLTKERARTQMQRRNLAGLAEEATRLEETIARRRAALQAKETQIADLRAAVARWKRDVATYREEMRRAEEIEIETLIEVLSLLKGFRIAEAKPAPEPTPPTAEPAAAPSPGK